MIGIIAGILGGTSAILFVHLIRTASALHQNNPQLIFILPFAGILIRYLYQRSAKNILEAPVLGISVFLTHLGGASAGREGAVIHFSRILATGAGQYLNFQDRKIRKLIIASIGAGFGAALGAPFAGLVFGFEENRSSMLRWNAFMHSVLGVVIAQFLVRLFHLEPFRIPQFEVPNYSVFLFSLMLTLGILYGLIAVLYQNTRKSFERIFHSSHPLLIGFIGGGILFTLNCFFGWNEFRGLGESEIINASQQSVSAAMTLKKMIMTIFSLGSGFQGGEFFPLAFMGSTLGSAFAFLSPTQIPLFAATGIISVYGAATQTPFACTILAAEMFGWKIIPFAALAMGMASRTHHRFNVRSDQDS